MSIKSNFCLLLILYCCIDKDFFGTNVNSSKASAEITTNVNVAKVNLSGFEFQYTIQNYSGKASIYWIVREKNGVIPTQSKMESDILGGRGLCSNYFLGKNYPVNYITQECSLKADTSYELCYLLYTKNPRSTGFGKTFNQLTFETGTLHTIQLTGVDLETVKKNSEVIKLSLKQTLLSESDQSISEDQIDFTETNDGVLCEFYSPTYVEIDVNFTSQLKEVKRLILEFGRRGLENIDIIDTAPETPHAPPTWFANLNQQVKDNMVVLLTQAIKQYGSFGGDAKQDLITSFEINELQAEQLYKFVYHSHDSDTNIKSEPETPDDSDKDIKPEPETPGIEKNCDEIMCELKTKRDQLGNMRTIMDSYHENADIYIIKSTKSCEQYYDSWKKTANNWGDGTIIDLQLANKCFKDVFEITKLNAINGIQKKLDDITLELKTKENRLGNMNTIMDSYHENVDINIIKSTNSCEQYYESWKKTATNWDDRTIIDSQLANKCFKDVFDITKLNAIEGLQTNKEILEKILIAMCAFFIVVIGISSYCIRRKYITLHQQITELKKTNTYSDISAEISVPLGTMLGPTYIPRGRSYECGTQDKLSFSPGRKPKHDFTTSTTYYCAPEKWTYQQERKRRTISISQPIPVFSLLEEYKPADSNPGKFNSILSNSEIQNCDYQSTMDAESA